MNASVGWGSYSVYEGPFAQGTAAFELPKVPTLNDYVMQTITATEGGRWNAVNMYDKCILTVGLIQWCEAGMFGVSDMLDALPYQSLLDPVLGMPGARALGVTFHRPHAGAHKRFFLDGVEVKTKEQQRRLFLLDSDGKKGSWDQASKEHAMGWAQVMVDLFAKPAAIVAQSAFTAARLHRFELPFARSLVQAAPSEPLGNAFVCAYLSFAANNSTWANKYLQVADGAMLGKAPRWSLPWLAEVLKQLTFGPRCAIYPHRYNKIRPVLERNFGIDLPDFAQDLEGWECTTRAQGTLLQLHEIQQILVDLGYDLGSSGKAGNGVDDVWGHKTQTALAQFQTQVGLEPADGWPGPDTHSALAAVRDTGVYIGDALRKRVDTLVKLTLHR
jgi:hypothetical protein